MISTTQAKQILEKNIELFIQDISQSTNQPNYIKSIQIKESEFPLFHPGSKAFFEYRSLEWGLEAKIRKYLVTDTLCDFLECQKINILLPKMKPGFRLANTSWHDAIESFFPFSFIMETPRRIGVRYTHFELSDQEILETIKKHHLDRAIVLRWDDNDGEFISFYNSPNTTYLHIKNFFEEYINKDIYYIYLNRVCAAVEKANKMLAFQAVPQLYSKNQSLFKISLLNQIRTSAFRQKKYLPGKGKSISGQLTKEQFDLLDSRFFDSGLWQSLYGSESFSDCLVTSEYLFKTIQEGQQLDYVSVIVSYIKAVEQLLYKFYLSAFRNNTSLSVWHDCTKEKYDNNFSKSDKYRVNPYNPKKYQHRIKKGRKEGIELGGLVYFLRYEPDVWAIDEAGKQIICSYLDDYCQSCRNGYFHKDNIYDYNEVLRIRHNTFLCFYYIFGGFKLADCSIDPQKYFGVVDFSFESFSEAMRNSERRVYYFETQDSQEILVVKPDDALLHKSLESNSLSFIRVKDYEAIFASRTENDLLQQEGSEWIEITYKNLPKKVWETLGGKKKQELLW